MNKKTLSNRSIGLIKILMLDSEIASKIKSKGVEGKSYSLYTICENGTIILGETKYAFWNRLIGCQTKLPFESWALAVWDALVNLSKGRNKESLEEGLSVEIAKKAQREEEYNWVVERLNDCYDHVCNNKDKASSAGDRGKSGLSETKVINVNDLLQQPIVINIKSDNTKRTFRFPDATGRASLNFDIGVIGVNVEKE